MRMRSNKQILQILTLFGASYGKDIRFQPV